MILDKLSTGLYETTAAGALFSIQDVLEKYQPVITKISL